MAEDNTVHGSAEAQDHKDENAPQQEMGGDRKQPPENKQDGDQNQSDEQEGDEPKQTWAGRIASGAIVVLCAVAIALVILDTNRDPRTDDAEVFANYIGLAPLVNGPITEIHVRDNQQVHAGEVLFRIDDRPYRYALEQARSNRAALEGQIEDQARQIRSLQSAAVAAQARTRTAAADVGQATSAVDQATADINDAEAAVARAEADYTYSESNLKRVEPLLARQFVTVDQVDQLRTGTAMKQLAVKQAEAQLRLARARLASNYAALTASRATVNQAAAQGQQAARVIPTLESYTGQRGARLSAIEDAQYNLNNCTVQAPFHARVTNLTLSEGAYARAGQQVFTLIDTRVWWVIANFRETQLHRILPGMHVDVYLMSNPQKMFRGVVDSAAFGVTPDAGTVGSLSQGLPDAQRTLSWVHLASRFPVRIRVIDPAPEQFRIAASAVVVVRGWSGW